MDAYLAASAFGSALRDDPAAAQFYDQCTSAQRTAILAQLSAVPDMVAFVRNLPAAAL